MCCRFRPPRAATAAALLGDIVIAYETLARECADEDKAFLHHLAHLTVHGFLHLIGYDHQTDSEADAMEGLESKIMLRMKLPDPYLARLDRGRRLTAMPDSDSLKFQSTPTPLPTSRAICRCRCRRRAKAAKAG